MMISRGAATVILTAGLVLGACGGDDDDTTSPTPTATATASNTVAVTFKVDTTAKVDGVNALAEVFEGEKVYIVGDFEGGCNYDDDPNLTCWKPQSPSREMTDEGNGIWSITIELVKGTALAYKYVKTTDDPTNNGWGNGVKDFELQVDRACTVDPEAVAGLWEIANLTYTVGDTDSTVDTYTVEAWRDYAETFGYPSCD